MKQKQLGLSPDLKGWSLLFTSEQLFVLPAVGGNSPELPSRGAFEPCRLTCCLSELLCFPNSQRQVTLGEMRQISTVISTLILISQTLSPESTLRGLSFGFFPHIALTHYHSLLQILPLSATYQIRAFSIFILSVVTTKSESFLFLAQFSKVCVLWIQWEFISTMSHLLLQFLMCPHYLQYLLIKKMNVTGGCLFNCYNQLKIVV